MTLRLETASGAKSWLAKSWAAKSWIAESGVAWALGVAVVVGASGVDTARAQPRPRGGYGGFVPRAPAPPAPNYARSFPGGGYGAQAYGRNSFGPLRSESRAPYPAPSPYEREVERNRSYAPPAYDPRRYGSPYGAPGFAAPSYGAPGEGFGGDWRQQQNEVREAVRQGRHIPLGQAIEAVRRRSPGRELDADLGPGPDGRAVYRLRWAASNGRRIDYLVDAATGAIVGVEGGR